MLICAVVSASLALSALPPTSQPFASLEPVALPTFESLLVPPASPSFVAEDEIDGDSPLSYTYIELGANSYSVDDFEGDDEDVDTYYLRGSLELGFLYIFAGYENQDLDFEDTASDLWRLGVGAHAGLTRELHLLGEVAWLFNDVSSDVDDLDESESGYEIRGGTRWLPWEWNRGGLEIDANLLFVSLDNRLSSDEEDLGVELGARAHFLEFLSVGAMYTAFEDDDQLGASVRFSF